MPASKFDNLGVEFARMTSFQRDILRVLLRLEEPYGLEIKESLEQMRDMKVNHGRLYPNLDKLVEGGYIEKGERDKRTNWYSLTEKGREAMSQYGQHDKLFKD